VRARFIDAVPGLDSRTYAPAQWQGLLNSIPFSKHGRAKEVIALRRFGGYAIRLDGSAG